MKKWVFLYSATMLQGALIGSAVTAQEATVATQDATVPAGKATAVEEITVTAQRREENLQRVPVAVSAFGAEDLQRKVTRNSTDLLKFVPNVVGFNNGNGATSANYYFRGVGAADGIQTIDTPVVTYVDEVPLGRIVGANLQFNDIERVEVLRGPQGTLFGRNVLGGAVLYTSRKPDDNFRLYTQASYGVRNHVDGMVSIDVPLTSNLFTSFSLHGMHEDPWQTSVLTGEKYTGQYEYGGRAAVRWVPTSNLEWNLAYDYSEQEGLKPNVPGQLSTVLGPTQTVPNANNRGGLALGDWNLLYTLADSCRTGLPKNGNSWALHNCIDLIATNQGITSNIKWSAAPDLTATLITGYRLTDYNYDIEFSGNTPGAAFQEFLLASDSHYKQFSQELKLNGSLFSDRIKYVGGLFYFYEGIRSQIDYYYLFPALGYTKLGRVQDDYLDNQTASIAGYLQGDAQVTDKLTVTAGGRYTHDVKHVEVNYLAYTPAGRNPAKDFNTPQISGSPRIESNRFTPKLGLQYQFTPQIMAYGSYTKGFQSGGWSGRASSALGFNSFGDQTVTSYEIGTRTELFDRRLRFNLTLFRAEYKDLQINTAYIPPGQSLTVFVTGNSGDAYDQGVEVESQFVLTENLTGHLAMGFQHSEYTRIDSAAIASSGFTLGGPLSYAPSKSFSGGAVWTRDIDALHGRLSLSSDFQYLPSFNPNLFAASRPTVDIFTINSDLSYAPKNSKLEVALECRNCTQNYYLINTSRAGGGALGEIPYYGIRLRYKL